MQLQRTLPELEKQGIGLAAISYDPPATLKAFADARGITFPLLSDRGSAVIREYGLLNAAATGRDAGIPHPGTFLLDARGAVVARAFEEKYQERTTAASLVGATTGGGRSETAHMVITPSVSDQTVAPGTRFSLLVDVAPKPRMHVYSPDQTTYIPVALTIDAGDAVNVHAPKFPPSERYLFTPLNEEQRVYSRPFRIVQEVTVALTPAMRQRARTAGATLTLAGSLKYQACDDRVCYAPVTVPLTWMVALEPLAR